MKISKSQLLKLVKAKCLDCCGFEIKEVKACTVKHCPLFAVRNGKLDEEAEMTETKKRKRGPMSPEHKAALKAGREKAKAAKTA